MSADHHWSVFWQADVVDACQPDNVEVRAGLVANWETWFGALPNRARLLDLGTGNGALALRAVRTADRNGREIEVHGVDLARIDPVRCLGAADRPVAARIRFQGGVSIERLPFADATFDAVCGQYAFEYALPTPAAAEAGRVLKPGGLLRLLVHSDDAAIGREVGILHHALSEIAASPIFDQARQLLRKLVVARRAGQPASPEIQRAISAFRAELDRLRAVVPDPALDGAAGELLTALASLPARALREPERSAGSWIEPLRQRLDAQLARFADMLRACLDADGRRHLARALRQASLANVSIRPADIDPPGVRVGYWIAAVRNSD